MKVAFDHQIFSLQFYGGISRYFMELTQGLSELGQDVKISAPLHINNYLSELPANVVAGIKLNRYPPKTARIFMAYNHYITNMKIRSWNPNIVHETYYSWLQHKKRKATTVLTVYDMIHELYPASFPKKDQTTKFKKNACNRADHIISISHSTKKDLIELFDINPLKISVVHLGVNLSNSITQISDNYRRKKPFLLYVGTRNRYKNFDGLLRAFSTSKRLRAGLDLIAFGGGKFTQAETALITSLGFTNNQIIQISGDDSLLNSLYKSASAFVYPSLYEGFGLPPLEAMSQSCPVIASNTSSMPEVISDAGIYFDPTNSESIRDAIENVIFDEEARSRMIAKGHVRAKAFSWEKCVQETCDVYHRFVG